MIDPYLLQDKDVPGKWWCFYKQNGIGTPTFDLKNWTYAGKSDAGENPCVILDGDHYVLFHSPPNGIGIKRSNELENWVDEGVLTLSQSEWPWAQGRLTAGFVLDLRDDPSIGKALMFFHGPGFPKRPHGADSTTTRASVSRGATISKSGSGWGDPGVQSRSAFSHSNLAQSAN